MTDHKEEYYLKRNTELTRALLKIKKQCREHNPENFLSATEEIYRIIEALNLESGWRP